jgi:hypothetical protein
VSPSFSPCDLASISPLNLSPFKGGGAARSLEDLDFWLGGGRLLTGLGEPTRSQQQQAAVSHTISSILGIKEEEEGTFFKKEMDKSDVMVAYVEEGEEEEDGDSYLPKKLRIAKRHSP